MIRVEINPPSKYMTRTFADFDLSVLSTVSKKRIREYVETGIIKGSSIASNISHYLLEGYKLPFVRLYGLQSARACDLCLCFYHYPIERHHERITKHILLILGVLFPGKKFTDTCYNTRNALYYVSRTDVVIPPHICDHVWGCTDYNPKTDPARLSLVEAVEADIAGNPYSSIRLPLQPT